MNTESSEPIVYFIKYFDTDGSEKVVEKTHPGEIFMDFMMLCANGYQVIETNIPGCCIINL